jgi:tryptophan synthase beta chain
LHGALSYLIQDSKGQVLPTHSISAGLDYQGVGPEHSYLKDIGRVKYFPVNDESVLEAFHEVSRLEGIIPALETAHAFAALPKIAKLYSAKDNIVVNVSGRGDKDIATVAKVEGLTLE